MSKGIVESRGGVFNLPGVVPLNLIILGEGEVVRERYLPAIRSIDWNPSRIAVASVEPHCLLEGLEDGYLRLNPSKALLPLDVLDERGFLGPETLVVNAVPAACRVAYAVQLAPYGNRMILEKPLAASAAAARALLPLWRRGASLHPLVHKLHTAQALAWLAHVEESPSTLSRISRVEGTFLERKSWPHRRAVEHIFPDLAVHLLSVLVATYRAGGRNFDILIDSVRAGHHRPDLAGAYQEARMPTAVRARFALLGEEGRVDCDFRVAKGVGQERKELLFLDRAGREVATVDLGESGWRPYARALQEFLKPHPETQQSIPEAMRILQAMDDVVARAQEEPPHEFGELPLFLCLERPPTM